MGDGGVGSGFGGAEAALTPEIVLVFGTVAGVVVLFATRWLRPDLVALLVMALLAVTGLVTTDQALAGFSNQAVIALAGMFVISAGLSRTGVARYLGRQVLRVAGPGETSLVVVLMLLSGVLSGFMNNVGVVAMMLPVVVGIARETERAPSKLLLPMVLGAQLGGLTTLIGTGPNLLAGEALGERGLTPLGLFDFTPIGGLLLVAGTAFVVLLSPRLVPARTPEGREAPDRTLGGEVELEDRLFHLRIPEGSPLDGRTLAQSLLGSAVGLHVLAVDRGGRRHHAPGPGFVLHAGDRLLVQGRADLLLSLQGRRHLAPEEIEATAAQEEDPAGWLVSSAVRVADGRVPADSPLRGRTLNQLDLRRRRQVAVVALRKEEGLRRAHFQDLPLDTGDRLLVQGTPEKLRQLEADGLVDGLELLDPAEAVERYRLRGRLLSFRVTPDSVLDGRSLRESRLGDALGLTVLGVARDGHTDLLPDPEEPLRAGDRLLAKAKPEDLLVLRGLQRVEVDLDTPVSRAELETDATGFAEVVLAPRTELAGKTLRQLNFRGRFGTTVLAVWREGRSRRTDLRDEELRMGDALVVFGPRDRLRALEAEPDLIVLQEVEEAPRTELAPRSILILAGALVPVVLGWVSIAVAVVAGSVLMVATRCLTPEEAYRSVDWSTVVLVAGMLALGTALENSGAATLLGAQVVETGALLGPRGVLAALCLLTIAACQVIPGSVTVVLLAPVAITAAADLGLSPHTLVLGIALTATTLASPVSHPAYLLVMAPGGYRMADFLKVGIPLTLLTAGLVVAVLPLLFPF